MSVSRPFHSLFRACPSRPPKRWGLGGLGGLLLTFAIDAAALDLRDPLAGALPPEPPRPLLSGIQDDAFVPCREPAGDLSYGLLDVVDTALCRNPQTHTAWANARAETALVGVALADYLPSLDAQLATSRQHSSGGGSGASWTQHDAALTLSWLLYDFGGREARLDYARQILSAATATLDATVQSVFLAALQAYYNAQAARAALVAAEKSEATSRESLAAAETRYAVGTATPADRLQAKTAWSQAVLDRIRAEGTLKTAFGTLANAMGRDAGTPLRLDAIPEATPDGGFSRDIAALIDEARRRRPDLLASEADLRAARASVDAARADGRPSLSLGVGPSWQRADGQSAHADGIGLTLTLPLFSGFATTYRVRAAEARVDAAAAQRDSLRLQVALDVWTYYHALTTATQALSSSADLLASAEQSERVALGRYKAGVGILLDVLTAQSALAAARQQRIQAGLDWHVSRAALARAIGTLDHRLLNPADAANGYSFP